MNESSEKYFDWAYVPDQYNWVAIDEDGGIFAHTDKPICVTKSWVNPIVVEYVPIGDTWETHENWRNLLFQRPTTEKP